MKDERKKSDCGLIRIGSLWAHLVFPHVPLRGAKSWPPPRTKGASSSGRSVWRPDSQTTRLRRNNRTRLQVVPVKRKHPQTDPSLLAGRQIHQAHNPEMRLSLDDSQSPEVLVQGHQCSPFPISTSQDLLVAGIGGPVAGPSHIVTCPLQLGAYTAPNACV